MTQQPDYFSNHSLKLRFPWSLYHRPIVEALSRVVALAPGRECLNLGSGPFLELGELPETGHRFTVCDVDPRAVEFARNLHGARLVGADVVQPDQPLPYQSDRFDLVVSMDVIEHVADPVSWSREVLRVLKPRGTLFLTTPNYSSKSLRLIESTALEAVARAQGFSRKHIHPSQMTPALLDSTLREAGAHTILLEHISLGWVLTAYARKQAID